MSPAIGSHASSSGPQNCQHTWPRLPSFPSSCPLISSHGSRDWLRVHLYFVSGQCATSGERDKDRRSRGRSSKLTSPTCACHWSVSGPRPANWQLVMSWWTIREESQEGSTYPLCSRKQWPGAGADAYFRPPSPLSHPALAGPGRGLPRAAQPFSRRRTRVFHSLKITVQSLAYVCHAGEAAKSFVSGESRLASRSAMLRCAMSAALLAIFPSASIYLVLGTFLVEAASCRDGTAHPRSSWQPDGKPRQLRQNVACGFALARGQGRYPSGTSVHPCKPRHVQWVLGDSGKKTPDRGIASLHNK